MLDALFVWEPLAHPAWVERLSELEAERPRPWTPALADELARRLAESPSVAWVLLPAVSGRSWQVRRVAAEVQAAVIEPASPRAADRLASLVAALANPDADAPAPALAFGHDADRETEAILDGLDRMQALPPLAYFDARASERLGGLERLRRAPCEVREVAGGALLVVRETICDEPTDEELARYASVRAFLGMGTLRLA
jgi:hypothetical protein